MSEGERELERFLTETGRMFERSREIGKVIRARGGTATESERAEVREITAAMDELGFVKRLFAATLARARCERNEQEADLKAAREANDGRLRAAETQALRAAWERRESRRLRRQSMVRRMNRYHS